MSLLEDEGGDVLKKARFGHGLSLEDAAQIAGVSPRDLEAVESLAQPVTAAYRPLATALGLREEPLLAMAQEEGVDEPLLSHVHRFKTPWGSFTYLVEGEGGAYLFDPAVPPAVVKKVLGERRIRALFITHGHEDHVATVDAFLALADEAYAHPDLAQRTGTKPITLGTTVHGFEVLPAPGHAADGVAYRGHGVLVTGDALFARSAGRAARADLYGEVLQTVSRLLQGSGDTVILPGHGGTSTVALERRLNPFFRES